MKTILILSNSGGGLVHFRGEVIAELCRSYKVAVIIPRAPGQQKIVKALEDLGATVISSEMERRSKNPFKDLSLLRRYKKIIREHEPDLVLTYTIKPNVYGGWAAQSLGVPYIANITGLGTTIQNGGLLSKVTCSLNKKGLKKAKCVFFQNANNHEQFKKLGIVSGKTRVIPGSGVNLDAHPFESYPDYDGTIKLLFIGRIMKDKGIGELLDAVESVNSRGCSVELDIIGNYVEDYKAGIAEAEEKGYVHYHGYQSDVNSFIKRSHCVVLPSYHEGMSNVMLEAASSGRPVITTNVPGCRETFEEGVTGFGCMPKDAESLADAIIKMVSLSNEDRAAMGARGRQKVEKEFNRKIIIDAYLEEVGAALSQNEE